jgi:glucose/arabinose dehydrogenase
VRRAALVAAAAVALLAPAGAAAARHLEPVGSFDSPVYVTATPADPGAIYVVEQPGRVLRVAGEQRSTLLDIRPLVLAGGEQGLLSVAFHPRYGTNRLFYVDYTARNGDTIVAEYRGGAAPVRVRTLVDLPDPASNHNGGLLVFGRDRKLWWGNGDGGGSGDQFGNGQRTDGRFAKLTRIDVDAARPSFRTWAIGLRNPWRFSFDRATGDLYVGDVGQNAVEEVDFVARPLARSRVDFGWNRYEGNAVYDPTTKLAAGWAYVPPVATYGHDAGRCSVTGGYVYRGIGVPAAVGRYFYGDYCTGEVWSTKVAAGRASAPAAESFRVPALSSFGEDARGELYLVSQSGPVYRLAG